MRKEFWSRSSLHSALRVEPHRQDVQRHTQVVGLVGDEQAEILTGWIGLASGYLRFILVWQLL